MDPFRIRDRGDRPEIHRRNRGRRIGIARRSQHVVAGGQTRDQRTGEAIPGARRIDRCDDMAGQMDPIGVTRRRDVGSFIWRDNCCRSTSAHTALSVLKSRTKPIASLCSTRFPSAWRVA